MTTLTGITIGGNQYNFDLTKLAKPGAFASVVISEDGKWILKILDPKANSETAVITSLVQKLPAEFKSFLVKSISVPPNQLPEGFRDKKVEIQELASGKNLEAFVNTEELSAADRLEIAVQTVRFFKAVNEAGFVYLDHKPSQHIYWNTITRAIKIIDWNIAHLKKNEDELQKDFSEYCRGLPELLDAYPYIDERPEAKKINYLAHPLNWPSNDARLPHKLTYSFWLILALTALTASKQPSIQGWDELLKILTDMQNKKTLWLDDTILRNYLRGEQALQDAFACLKELLLGNGNYKLPLNVSVQEAITKIRKRVNYFFQTDTSDLEKISHLLFFSRVLDPKNVRYYAAYELWRIYCLYPGMDILHKLIKRLIDSDYSVAEWGSYAGQIDDLFQVAAVQSNENIKLALSRIKELGLAQARIFAAESADFAQRVALLSEARSIDTSDIELLLRLEGAKGDLENNANLEKSLTQAGENLASNEIVTAKICLEQFFQLRQLHPSASTQQMDQKYESLNAQLSVFKKAIAALQSWDISEIEAALKLLDPESR